jgi:hypothetical protein
MRIGVVLALAAVLCAGPACKRKRTPPSQSAQEAKRIPISVTIGDPRSAQQLINGFFDIEDNAWRWTTKQFTIELGTPLGASGRGATLEFHFVIPEVVLQANQSVTLSAAVDGNVLPPQTYTQAGDQVYKQDVPGSLMAKESVKVVFDVDKAYTPGGADTRALGVIAMSASLVRK